MFIDLNDINDGLDLIYGKGKRVVNRAAQQAANKIMPNVSGYKQMIHDTFPKGYNAVNNLTRAIQQAPDVQGKAKVVRSAYNQMLKDTAPKVDAYTQRVAKDLATKITGVSPDKQSIRAVKKVVPKQTVSNVAKGVAETAIKEAPSGWQAWTPFLGDSLLLGTAGYNATHGHPVVGTGQALIAGGGLVADAATVAQLLAAPFTGGASAGTAALTQAGKAGLKKAALTGLEKAIIKGAETKVAKSLAKKNTPLRAGLRTAGGEALNFFRENEGNNEDDMFSPELDEKVVLPEWVKNKSNRNVISRGHDSFQDYNSQPIMSVADFTRLNGGQYNNDEYQLPQLPTAATPDGGMDLTGQEVQQQQGGNNLDLSQILELYREMNKVNEPYLERLQDYSKRYPELQGEAFNRDRYLAAMSGLAENPAYQRMIGNYNPAEIEAQQIDLEGKVSAQRQKQLEDLMELMGNATIANELGLPVTAAMANKNLLNTYTGMGKAQLGLQGKMYSADRSAQAKMYVADRISKAKEYDTYLDNQVKLEVAKGNWSNAQKLQQMKNENRIQTSIITGIPFADINQLFAGTNAMGVTDINTTGLGGNSQPGNNMQYFN